MHHPFSEIVRFRFSYMNLVAMFFVLWASLASAQERQAEYLLAAGDIGRVTVFQNSDLTLETRITESGTISYPLIGTVKVGGMTLPAAEQAIAAARKNGGFLREPQLN